MFEIKSSIEGGTAAARRFEKECVIKSQARKSLRTTVENEGLLYLKKQLCSHRRDVNDNFLRLLEKKIVK